MKEMTIIRSLYRERASRRRRDRDGMEDLMSRTRAKPRVQSMEPIVHYGMPMRNRKVVGCGSPNNRDTNNSYLWYCMVIKDAAAHWEMNRR
jgi:hypothetical protein